MVWLSKDYLKVGLRCPSLALAAFLEAGRILKKIKHIVLIFILVSPWTCSNHMGSLNDGKRTVGIGSSQENSEANKKTPVYEEEDEVDLEEDIQAEIPAIISGSYLSFHCAPSKGDINIGSTSINCELEGDRNDPYIRDRHLHAYLLARGSQDIIEIPVNKLEENDSLRIDFAINSYIDFEKWIVAFELSDQKAQVSSLYMDDVTSILNGEGKLVWVDLRKNIDIAKIYVPRIVNHKQKDQDGEDKEIVITTEDEKILVKPVYEGFEAFGNTELVDGNLRVLIVYDQAGLPVHQRELDFLTQQIKDFAVNEGVPIRIELMKTSEFIAADTLNAALVIWNDLGAGGANFTKELVEKFKRSYAAHIPFFAIGADLTTYHLNRENGVLQTELIQQWSSLIRLGVSIDQGNRFDRTIMVAADSLNHKIADGPYGQVTQLSYNDPMDHPSFVTNGGQIFAVDQFGNIQAVIFDLNPEQASSFALNCLLYLIAEREIAQILFKNAISNMLAPLKEALQ